MDSNGVPKKINRHVLKALITVLEEGLKFPEVLKYVQFCNKKLKPVPNIKQVVSKSLANFQKIGLIHRDKTSRYKITTLVLPKTIRAGRVTKRTHGEGAKQTYISDPGSWRRSINSSEEEETVESTPKRFRTYKNLNREGVRVDLPRARRKKNTASLGFPSNCQHFACNVTTANFDEDISVDETDENSLSIEDDEHEESMKSLTDEENEGADEKIEPVVNNQPESPITEDQRNNENSEGTRTTELNVPENTDTLDYGLPSYLH